MTFLTNLHGRPNTLRTYESLARKWILPILLIDKPEKILKTHLDIWNKHGLSPRTIKTLLFLFRKYVEHQGGRVETTHVVRAVMRSQQETEFKTITADEVVKLCSACFAISANLTCAVAIACYTGMRRGEVFGLKWEDVDFEKKAILVRRSYDGPTKNGRTRKIPLHPFLQRFLMGLYKNKSDNYIEDSKIVKEFDPSFLLKKASKKALGYPITFHQLRHTFATLALEAGRSPKMVQQTLGHSKLSTTLDHYWQSTQESLDMGFLDREDQ